MVGTVDPDDDPDVNIYNYGMIETADPDANLNN